MRMKWLEEYKCWVFDDGSIATPAKTGIRIKKQWKDREGYFRVSFYKSTHTNAQVHRLLALAFIPNPENKPTVDHKDRNPENNSLDNLRWATYSENNLNKAVGDSCLEKYGVRSKDRQYTSIVYHKNKETKDNSLREWRANNREHYNAYMREYNARRRASNG